MNDLLRFIISTQPNTIHNIEALELSESKPLLLYACSHRNTKAVQLLLNVGLDPNIGDNSSNMPLHFACEMGDAEMARLLLLANALPNPMDATVCFARCFDECTRYSTVSLKY
jgi:ankyrin repeat protein